MSARVVVVAPVDVAARLAAALGGAGLPVEGCGPDPATVPPRGDVVVVVDVGLDDAAPVGAPPVVDTVLEAAPGAAVLAVAADVVPGQVLAALRAGASGFLRRDTDGFALADAVRRVAAGDVVFGPGIADLVLDAHGAGASAGPVVLTEREADVVRLVVDGLTARQIGVRLVLSPRTVENHVQRIQRKLGVSGRAAMVRFAIENGLA